MTTVYMVMLNPTDNEWYPVARVERVADEYRFVYTKGANSSPNFRQFGVMKDWHGVYRSSSLLPLLSNRVLSRGRPEYSDFVSWLDLDPDIVDPLQLLAVSGGVRQTDSLVILPLPEETRSHEFRVRFFVNGIAALLPEEQERLVAVQERTALHLLPDFTSDSGLFALGTQPRRESIIGYCPKYLGEEFLRLSALTAPRAMQLNAIKVNPNAPLQLRVLCEMHGPWPQGYSPFQSESFESLAEAS